MESSKQIWVFNHFASTPKTNTGAGERHYYLAEEFAKHGYKTTVFSAAYNHLFLQTPKRSFPCTTEEFENDIKFVWVWALKYKPTSGLGRLLNWLSYVLTLFIIPKKKFGKPSIIIVSSMSMWPILNAFWYRFWHSNVKVIFEIRDIWPLTPVEIGGVSRGNPIIRIMFALERLAYKRANQIVSVLPRADLRIREVLGRRSIKYAWIPNASSTSLSDIFPNESSKSESKIIVYAGAIGPANSLDLLVDIANEMKDDKVDFHVVGDGPEKSKLQTKVGELKLSNVLFTGKVKKEQVKSYLTKADALFIAWHNIELYKYGVSANKYNDYMALGKPIISVGDIANDPVEVSGCGITIKSRSAREAAEKIREFFALDNETLNSIGNNGLSYWKSNKTYPVIGDKYIEIFNKILNDK